MYKHQMATTDLICAHGMRYNHTKPTSLGSGASFIAPYGDTSADYCHEKIFSNREWRNDNQQIRPPQITPTLKRRLGKYPLTSAMSGWVLKALTQYKPSRDALDFVRPFSAQLHDAFTKEYAVSTGLHDLRTIELAHQVALEVCVEILLASTANGHAVSLQDEIHSSCAAGDDHYAPWGKLLTGLVCDPPIVVQFPTYLMMCESFGFEKEPSRENYVYSALTAVDWVKGNNAYSDRFEAFQKHAFAMVPTLSDKISGIDRSFWRVSQAYLGILSKAENACDFTTPLHSHIKTGLDPYLLLVTRGIDSGGTAYMCSDGATFLDDAGMDSLIGSALPNDVMDLHTDILTGETRNIVRLLYPNGQSIEQTIKTMSTVLSGELCEIFRGHQRVRFEGREDGRISATSPAYSLSRARHRRIFETLETYMSEYDQFWDWTWELFRLAKEQTTDAGLNELLADALCRGIDQTSLPESGPNDSFTAYFDMVEAGEGQMSADRPLGVCSQLADITRKIYRLWHTELLDPHKRPGWGRAFDDKSDFLFQQAGELLDSMSSGITDEVYEFAIAYRRLSTGLPYIAYHTVDAIILANGVVSWPAVKE
ncbi:hypothetical protein E4U23_008463 [Claviceps purpurea]|nr:hypothetical protein E4U26_003876 [Claviceps purpurea]KAG6252739.1 hypothetical protein E4U23_008463 [Claviceps purpurea]